MGGSRRNTPVPASAQTAHPGPPTVEYATLVDRDYATVEVSFGDRLVLVFTIWGGGEAITVRTIEEAHVDLDTFRAAFVRYSREAEVWAKNIRVAALSQTEEGRVESPAPEP